MITVTAKQIFPIITWKIKQSFTTKHLSVEHFTVAGSHDSGCLVAHEPRSYTDIQRKVTKMVERITYLKIFHASVAALNTYAIWYDQMYVELPFPSKEIGAMPFKARHIFLTVWCLVSLIKSHRNIIWLKNQIITIQYHNNISFWVSPRDISTIPN